MYFNISLAAGDVCCRAGSVDHISVMREEREDRTEILLGRVERQRERESVVRVLSLTRLLTTEKSESFQLMFVVTELALEIIRKPKPGSSLQFDILNV